MRTIAIINQKGGCGKTTSAINLAGIFARSGFRTLLVDMDPQGHCAAGLAIPEQRIEMDIGDALSASPEATIDTTKLLWRASRNLDLAPSRMRLAGLEAARGALADQPNKERRLGSVLSRIGRNYDVCLIDCSPSIGLLAYNALAAADGVLIPVETSYFALQGATKQVNTIRTLSKRLLTSAPYWLVATIHDESSVLSRDLLEELRRRFGKRVAPPVIRRDVTLREAASFGQPVIEYAPTSVGAADYGELATWLIEAAGLACTSRPRTPERIVADPTEVFTDNEPDEEPGNEPENEPEAPIVQVPPARGKIAAAPVEAPVAVADVAGSGVLGSADTATVQVVSRAEDLAQRARLLQLRRADERLRDIASSMPRSVESPTRAEMTPATVSSPSASIRHLFGQHQTRSGTLFVQPLSSAISIAVAGDFNGWSTVSHRMRRNDELGVFELCVPLAPGRHRYRLIIDGRWCADPFNDATEPNPFGELNSVADVGRLPAAIHIAS